LKENIKKINKNQKEIDKKESNKLNAVLGNKNNK
jgi:hypothetical protein